VIINTHAHVGDTRVFDVVSDENELIQAMDEHGIDLSLVMPSAGCRDAAAVHDQIYRLGQRHPGRVIGLVQANPHLDPEAYEAEATRCVKELGFVGLKIHPLGYGVNPLGKSADNVFRVGQQLGVPVMVHTGSGIPWALPSLCILPAQKYPDLPIILAHAGMGVFMLDAYVAAKVCPNIYLETSWAKPGELKWLIGELGAERIMMGADLVSNMPVELFKYRSLGLAPEVLDRCLGGTAMEVFNLRGRVG
jgi:predicted TIM-barrel fold metal-dependent hydrolase